jgi:hypothetical protein
MSHPLPEEFVSRRSVNALTACIVPYENVGCKGAKQADLQQINLCLRGQHQPGAGQRTAGLSIESAADIKVWRRKQLWEEARALDIGGPYQKGAPRRHTRARR